jgi:hypothetical protein
MADSDWLAAEFEVHRDHLLAVAYPGRGPTRIDPIGLASATVPGERHPRQYGCTLQAGDLESLHCLARNAAMRTLTGVSTEFEFDFDLVVDPGSPDVSTDRWAELMHAVLHLQPAKTVMLDDNGRVIHIRSYGQRADMATGLLADVERLARTKLRVTFPAH